MATFLSPGHHPVVDTVVWLEGALHKGLGYKPFSNSAILAILSNLFQILAWFFFHDSKMSD